MKFNNEFLNYTYKLGIMLDANVKNGNEPDAIKILRFFRDDNLIGVLGWKVSGDQRFKDLFLTNLFESDIPYYGMNLYSSLYFKAWKTAKQQSEFYLIKYIEKEIDEINTFINNNFKEKEIIDPIKELVNNVKSYGNNV